MAKRELGLFDLVVFNVVATLGVQWIGASAHVGPLSIVLHLLAAVFFFVPSAFVVSALSARFPAEDGFFSWVLHAFGERHAFIVGWCWWLSVLLYLPGLLLAGAGMILGDLRPLHLTAFTTGVLWVVVWINALGLRVSKWLSNAGGTLTYLAGFLVLGASVTVAAQQGAATSFSIQPRFNFESISLWAQIAFAYTGLELGSLVTASVRDARRTVPRAVWISAVAVAGAYMLGSVSLMLVLPPAQIHPMTGLIGVASAAGSRLGFAQLGSVAAALLFTGIVGKLGTWSTGAARVPALLGITNVRSALALQGAVCTLFLLMTQAGETVRAGWQTLTDMAILTGLAPFIYIFLAAWRFGLRVSAACGLAVTSIAIVLSLVPPDEAVSAELFLLKVLGGCALSAAAGLWLHKRRRVAPLQ